MPQITPFLMNLRKFEYLRMSVLYNQMASKTFKTKISDGRTCGLK